MTRRVVARVATAEISSCECGSRWDFYRPRLSFSKTSAGATFQPVRCEAGDVRGAIPWPVRGRGGARFRARGRRVGP